MKKHTFFKVAMMLLALVLIVSCFASCNKDNNDPKDSDPKDSSTKTPDGDATGEATNTPDTGKDTEGPEPHVHTFGAWEVTTPATCKTEGERKHTCIECNEVETEKFTLKNSINGSRIMFAGNSMTYYGEVVINKNGTPTSDKGVFETIAEKFGDKIEVTNFTYGAAGLMDGRKKAEEDGLPASYENYGLYQLMTVLHPGYYNNPDNKPLDQFYNQDYVIFQQRGSNIKETYNQLQQLAALFPEKTQFVVMMTHYDIRYEGNVEAIKKTLDDGWIVLPWGQMLSDIYEGKVTSLEYTYSYEDFINTADNVHPNFLTGYIEALMTYCAITGNTAQGVDYSFVNKSYEFYADESETKFVKVLENPAEMARIQELIDQYLTDIGNKSKNVHTYGEWTEKTAATCAKNGTKERTCSVCGHTETAPTTKKHDFGAWLITTEATAQEAGIKTRTCKGCGLEETKKYTLNLLTGLVLDKANSFGINSIKHAKCATDGVKNYDPNANTYLDIKTTFGKDQMNDYTNIAEKYLPDGSTGPNGKYLCGFYYELAAATKIGSFALYNTATLMDIDGFDILVSEDGVNWEVVYSAENLVGELKYEIVDENTNMIEGTFDAKTAKYVMFALTAPRSRNADATAGYNEKYHKEITGPNANPHYFRIVEFEIFEAE